MQPSCPPEPRRRVRLLALWVGVVVPQVVLLAPALAGRAILLPLDILGEPRTYLPLDPARPRPAPQDRVVHDLVLQHEIYRRAAVAAVRSGRMPLWSPLNYCGSPFLAANQTAVLSPFRVLDYLWPGPLAIAWGQLFKGTVAGLGAYVFFRRTLGVGFAAAVLGASCYPLTGFLVLWAGFPHAAVVSWLPWVLSATDGAVRRPGGWSGVGLALATAAALLSGHSATAVQVLLAAGVVAAWSLLDEHGPRGLRRAGRGVLALAAGWGAGMLLAAPQALPTLEYMQASQRIGAREQGVVETPPMGLSALPQLVLPYIYGATARGSAYLTPGNRLESAAAGYAGLIAALGLAPLALWSRRHRSPLALCLALAVLGLAQTIDLPIVAWALGHWPLRLLRNNRLVFVTGWALLSAAVVGLEVLAGAAWRTSRAFWALAAPPASLGLWCLARTVLPPPELARALVRLTAEGHAGGVAAWFHWMFLTSAALCAFAALFWLCLRHPVSRRPWFAWTVGGFAVGELLLNSLGTLPMSDPALYYPSLPVLAALAKAPPGRVCGMVCLPPNLNQTHGLADVRGYDAADPQALLDLLELMREPAAPASPGYALTMGFVPRLPSPLADLLGLRYLVFRGVPPPDVEPMLVGPDYWVLENPRALPRAFVPREVELVSDPAERLRRLADAGFDPREVALVDSGPAVKGPVAGAARIVTDEPERVRLVVETDAPGLLVLVDRWDPGWKAFVDGKPAAVLRANHAFRGVPVPSGRSLVEFRYKPESFRWGLRLFAAGSLALLFWGARLARKERSSPPGGNGR